MYLCASVLQNKMCLPLLRTLIDAGIDVNARLEGAWPALHLAAAENDVSAVTALLVVGAVTTANNVGRTPLQVACSRDDDKAPCVVYALLPLDDLDEVDAMMEMNICCKNACARSTADVMFVLKRASYFDDACANAETNL